MLLVVGLPTRRVGDAADERPSAVAVARAHREDLRPGAGYRRLEAARQLLPSKQSKKGYNVGHRLRESRLRCPSGHGVRVHTT